MDIKLTLICAVFLIFTALDMAYAEFLYNHVLPKAGELKGLGLKCIPGRTVIKIHEDSNDLTNSDDVSDDEGGRRSHTNFKTSDESCQMCVCSIEGKDEYCSNRPAMNVNECLRMVSLTEEFKKNEPFEHERSLSFRIRRDLIWHNDEIPYNAKAKCRRSTSYYSNSVTANDTDIDVPSEIESLLDYSNKTICFYCVCSVHGDGVGCIPRNPWFCEYFRKIRNDEEPRDRYRLLFQQDRPVYFRQLSYRLRRTMDNGIFDMIDTVGSGLSKNQKCVPFVSEYTDCNDDNRCSGCTKCTCTADGVWKCDEIQECEDSKDALGVEDGDIERSLEFAQEELFNYQMKEAKQSPSPYVPKPEELDVYNIDYLPRNVEFEVMSLMRAKRSLEDDDSAKDNGTVTFHNIVDEVNEDTLKTSNTSGTLQANKMEVNLPASRRTDIYPVNSTSNSLHIKHLPTIYNPHAGDNKVDTLALHDDKEDLLIHHKIFEIVGNRSLSNKDKDLSKLLVNEMKIGSETIGDQNTVPVSNITFTPDNDTLTAVTFIAGNLLNKLWNMEKDVNDNSMDTEHMKHRTINNLLELFKEPLNLRQETFLKRALEQISTAMENDETSNVSMCENVQKLSTESVKNGPIEREMDLSSKNLEKNKQTWNLTDSAADAFSKISNTLDLITKFERVQNSLMDKKSYPDSNKINSGYKSYTEYLTKNEEATLDVFGNILASVTKLLMPIKQNKKFIKGLKSKNTFNQKSELQERFRKLNLADLSISDKDKIVLDYLTHIQNTPHCLLNKQNKNPIIPVIEGNILLNLSEFFKIKSMSDLLKLVDTTNPPQLRSKFIKTTTEKMETDFTTEISTKSDLVTETNKATQFKTTKDKLKSHLKTILEDLIELQNINGKSANGKRIEIADALPCIYNLLNANKNQGDIIQGIGTNKENGVKPVSTPTQRVTEIFNKIKKELKFSSQTRRTNVGIDQTHARPKSAVVWERTIKNMGKNVKTRRSMDVEVSKSLEDLKNMMDDIETSGSNTYKSVAILSEVPVIERLLLLRTLIVDSYRYINFLKELEKYMDPVTILEPLPSKTIDDFIENVNMNTNLNEKVLKDLNKPKAGALLLNKQVRFKKVGPSKSTEEVSKMQWKDNNVKLSRDEILNQLIKNRMMFYIRMKESSFDGTTDDINYNLAKKILLYLEMGNYNLAKNLFKIFISQNKSEPIRTFGSQVLDPETYYSLNKQKSIERRLSKNIVPLIQFQDPTPANEQIPWSNQDQLIKQLLTIKNLKE